MAAETNRSAELLSWVEDLLAIPMVLLSFVLLVHLYGFAVFGVITAELASWFIESDRRQARRQRSRESRELSERIQHELTNEPAGDEDLRARVDRLIALMEEREAMEKEEEE